MKWAPPFKCKVRNVQFEMQALRHVISYGKASKLSGWVRGRGNTGAIHSTKLSGNFGPKLNGSVRSNRKSFGKTGPPFEVVLFSRSDRLKFWLNGSRPQRCLDCLNQPLPHGLFYHLHGQTGRFTDGNQNSRLVNFVSEFAEIGSIYRNTAAKVKDGNKNFRLEYSDRENRTTFSMFRCSRKCSAESTLGCKNRRYFFPFFKGARSTRHLSPSRVSNAPRMLRAYLWLA